MKVKIFNSQSTFNGITYNFSKLNKDQAELMCVENFHALGLLQNTKAQDFIDYLFTISATSKVEKPQFHAAITSEDNLKNKWELTEIAKKWLEKMGYADQPYLIFFHYDTNQNHVHIVSTRVNKQGKGINNAFESLKSIEYLNLILNIDPQKQALADLNQALSYKFSSRTEFVLLLFSFDYQCILKNNNLCLIRYGRIQASLPLDKIYASIRPNKYNVRLYELKDIFLKGLHRLNSNLQIKSYFKKSNFSSFPMKCNSDFITHLKNDFNIQLIFHSRAHRIPTDYCVIDHNTKMIFEGNQIIPIDEFIRPVKYSNYNQQLSPQENEQKVIAHNTTASIIAPNNVDFDFTIEITNDCDPKDMRKRKRKQKKNVNN